ncbi:unnamed protein product [Rotaria sp. Silwood2]|nr:unnamed protein product [Rotaria sp. Silwood2]CAF3367032.1 unnamed protein product [Rotaria sp. Silwood2]CAF4138297.1 unnamed protein product [Rotaria sp. Silwood2]CAF4357984.1 unnamed protein product [Rotaria sp. Silwood2]
MDGQDIHRYQPGRGLPTYLLSRNYADSSTDNGGASRIRAASRCSMTADEDSEFSSISHVPRTFSYMSTSSSFTWSDKTSISMPPSTFQYERSSASRSTDDETRTIQGETFSMQMEYPPIISASSSFGEASSTTAETKLSSVALVSGLLIEKLANTLVPGQGQQLIEIAQLQSQTREEQQLQLSITNEMVQSLKKVYDIYVKQNIPFIDQVRILSLLPRPWKCEKVMSIVGCTRHAVKAAHQMYDDEEYILNRDQKSTVRHRADPEEIKHFKSWLVESDALVSGRV